MFEATTISKEKMAKMEDPQTSIANPSDKSNEYADISTIDEMTLQLLTNHVQYKRYLSKSNPAKYAEKREFLNRIDKYKSRISELTAILLENPEKPITNEINDIFNEYTKVLCRHFEMKDLENTETKYSENYDYREEGEEDDDELFGNMERQQQQQQENSEIEMNKFWSKKGGINKKNATHSFWSDVSVFRK
jgi:hypothetical protein